MPPGPQVAPPPRATLLAVLVAVGVVLHGLDAPIIEDALFWWVPQGHLAAERGPMWVLDRLPQVALPRDPLPPQWAAGLPDYGHPPLWYWTLGAFFSVFGGSHHVVHLAALPLAALMAWGYTRLMTTLAGPGAAWGAAALPLLPPVAAQLQNADTDLPLLALTPWALLAVVERQQGRFAALASLATGCKEPGVLLSAPALLSQLARRRLGWGWAWPLIVLATWAGIHEAEAGWALAGSERLPPSVAAWGHDLGQVLRICAWEQGRWVLVLAALWGLGRGRWQTRPVLLLGVHLGVQVGFYSTLNFLGGLDRVDAFTHVRYLLSAILALGALGLALCPRLGLVVAGLSLWTWHLPSRDGTEASLWGIDQGRAVREAAPALRGLPRPVWVGSYAFTQLTRPYAGVVEVPVPELSVYTYGTDPAQVEGYVVETTTGEPLGRLQELELEPVEEFRVHHAWVRVHRVRGRRAVSAPPGAATEAATEAPAAP